MNYHKKKTTKARSVVAVYALKNSSPDKLAGAKSFGLPAVKSCPMAKASMSLPLGICTACYADNGLHFADANLKSNHEITKTCERSAYDLMPALRELVPSKAQYYRWFWSGDCTSKLLAQCIHGIAKERPKTSFWISTKTSFFDDMPFLENLTIRKSSLEMNDETQSAGVALPGYAYDKNNWICPGDCHGCRICWSHPDVKVLYPWHGSAVARLKLYKQLRAAGLQKTVEYMEEERINAKSITRSQWEKAMLETRGEK